MAKFSLRKAEDQATASIVLSLCSLFFVLALAVLVFRHFDPETKSIFYKGSSLRMPLIAVCGVLALGSSVLGFGFGISSAGQRRNQRTGLSWTGFFVGATSISVTLILLATFFLWKESIVG